MGVKVTTKGSLPRRVWDVQAMRELALAARAAIVTRAFREGRGLDDQPHTPAYSEKPITIWLRSETAMRLTPKGGEVVKGKRGARKGQIIGRRYDGGYAEYKRLSRTTSGKGGPKGAAVDLTLSGQLQREFKIKHVEQFRAVIGLTGGAVEYGSAVNDLRPWIGASPHDRKVIAIAARDAMHEAMRRSQAK